MIDRPKSNRDPALDDATEGAELDLSMDLEPVTSGPAARVKVVMQPLGELDGELGASVDAGLLFFTQMPQPAGSRSRLWIVDPTTHEQVPAMVEVTAAERASTSALTGLRVSFVDLDAETRSRLERLWRNSSAAIAATPAPAAALPPVDNSLPWQEQVRVFERTGRHTEALDVLRAVADREPMNVDVHLRIASLALTQNDFKLATWHAEFVARIDRNRPEPAALFAEIEKRRQAKQQTAVEAKKPITQRTPTRRAKKRILIGLAALLIAGGTTYSVYRKVAPKQPPRQALEVGLFQDLVPCTAVELIRGRIYVTTSPAWAALSADDRRQRLTTLGERAKSRYSSDTVILLGPGLKTLGMSHQGRVTLTP